ncbi:MAG TPA: ABC transporter permease [Thermomicrobiales bacterium]|nr:ABC transporter permease [Thermomicrobiales bacterium]
MATATREEQARRFQRLERLTQRRFLLLLAPAVIFLAVFYAYPVAAMLLRAFNDPTWGFGNFAPLTAARSPFEILGVTLPMNAYVRVIWITIQIALGVTITTLLLGYPVAYALASLPASRANVLMIFILVPFWTSILVRTYAWMALLGRDGLINEVLMGLRLVDHPASLLNTRLAVYIGMVHILLPFMILPLYAVMRGIDRNLMRAAENLGARPWQVFRRVFLPLSLPGVAAGCLLVFILSLGFYITPSLLGGQRDIMISMLIQQQVTQLRWGFASALGLALLVISLIFYLAFVRLLGVQRIFGGARR